MPNGLAVRMYLLPLLEWAKDKLPDNAASSTPIFLRVLYFLLLESYIICALSD